MYTSMFRKAMLGDTATLNLDFTTGVLDSRLTFTRASTATYINSSGYIASMGAAVTNDPTKARFDYDPTTLAPRGLLIEGSAINYMLYSTALDPHTALNMRTISTASITDPEGTTDKARIVAADGSTGSHSRYRFASAGTNTTVTVSIFAKKNGYKYLYLSDGSTGRGAARFDLDDGSISGTVGAGFVSATVTAHPHGWWRCSIVVNVIASASYAWSYVGAPTTGATYSIYNAAYTGEDLDDKGIYCYGFQVEAGAGASSYIHTAASQVTRNADNCELLDLTTISFNASAGTIYTDVGVRLTTGSARNYTFLPASGASNQIFEGSGIAFNVYSSASFVAQIGTSNNTSQKIAAAYALNDYAVSVAGGAVSTDTSGAVPTSLTKLTIGGSVINSASYMNGCIRVFKYYPTRLTNAQLQALTAP